MVEPGIDCPNCDPFACILDSIDRSKGPKKFFRLKEEADRLSIQEWRSFETAWDLNKVLEKLRQFEPQLHYCHFLINLYVTKMVVHHYDDISRQILREIIDILRNQTRLPVKADELFKYAEHLTKNQKCLKAILFFYIAADFYDYNVEERSNATATKLKDCVMNIKCIIKTLLEYYGGISPGLKPSIERHVIPLMREIIDTKLKLRADIGRDGDLLVIWSLKFLEWCHGLVKDYDARLSTINEACEMCIVSLGERRYEDGVYGKLLHNKGIVLKLKGDFQQAENCYRESLTAFEQTTNFPTERIKTDYIQLSRNELENVVARQRRGPTLEQQADHHTANVTSSTTSYF